MGGGRFIRYGRFPGGGRCVRYGRFVRVGRYLRDGVRDVDMFSKLGTGLSLWIRILFLIRKLGHPQVFILGNGRRYRKYS